MILACMLDGNSCSKSQSSLARSRCLVQYTEKPLLLEVLTPQDLSQAEHQVCGLEFCCKVHMMSLRKIVSSQGCGKCKWRPEFGGLQKCRGSPDGAMSMGEHITVYVQGDSRLKVMVLQISAHAFAAGCQWLAYWLLSVIQAAAAKVSVSNSLWSIYIGILSKRLAAKIRPYMYTRPLTIGEWISERRLRSRNTL